MERKIGERFTVNGKTYLTIKGDGACDCKNCAFWSGNGYYENCGEAYEVTGDCSAVDRDDGNNVRFKRID